MYFRSVAPAGGPAPGARLGHEDRAPRARQQPRVVLERQPRRVDDAAADAVDVDHHVGGRVVVRPGLAFLVRPSVAGALLLVAPGQERRRLAGAQQRQVEGSGDGTVVGRHVEPTRVEPVVGRCQEVQVLPRRVPDGCDGVGHPVGELVRLARPRVVDHDGPQLVVEPARVRNPARVGRPHRVHRPLGVGEAVGVDVVHRARLDVEDQQSVMRVGERQLRAVGRPLGPEVERRVGNVDAARARPVLPRDDQAVLAARVVEPRDARAVGRPHRVAVGHAGGAGQVAPRALPRRYAEQLAPPLEEGAPARRRQAGAAQPVRRHLLPARPRPVHVAGRANLQLPGAARRRIELVQVARVLVDDDAGARPQRLHVEVRVPGELPLRSRAGVERPDVAGPVALGQIVDDAVHPRRVHLALALPRRRHPFPRRRRHDGDRLRLAAAVVPPLRIPVADLLVRQVLPVRGHLPQVGLRERERARQPPRGRHRVELPLHGRHALAARPEEHLAVRGPALNHVLGRVPRQPLGLPAGRGHDVDVGVAPVLAREGDPAPVGAERRIGLGAVRAGEPRGVAAVTPRDPQVVGVHEDDVRPADVGLPQEARPLGVGDGRRREGRGAQERENEQPAGGNRVVAEHAVAPV